MRCSQHFAAIRSWLILPLIYAAAAIVATCAVPQLAHAQSGVYQATPPALTNGQRGDFRLDADGSLIVSDTPSATAAAAAVPAVNGGATQLLAKATPGNVYGLSITTGATAGYVYLLNRTTIGATGAVTAGVATNNFQFCAPVAANTSLTVNFTVPMRGSAGIGMAWSSTGCATLTPATDAVYQMVLDL